MKTTTPETIKTLAKEYQQLNQAWHFHILTPSCLLNENDKFALVLENTETGISHISYSDEPYMGIGKELVKLLHGDDVVKEKGTQTSKPSETVQKLLDRARELQSKGIYWHHHLLFPGCMFNDEKEKYCIVFEDPETKDIMRSVSDIEPKADLQHIEGMFYNQKK